jgi:hypothetical protein
MRKTYAGLSYNLIPCVISENNSRMFLSQNGVNRKKRRQCSYPFFVSALPVITEPLAIGSFHSIETLSDCTAVTEIESGVEGLSDKVVNSCEDQSDASDPELIVRTSIR